MGDPGQFEQIVLNLVTNARDAMPVGGELSIKTANLDVEQAYPSSDLALAPGRYVVLEVEDTGHGMSADIMAHLFEPFFTTKGDGERTGLGLASVYGTVKQLGGEIEANSLVDVGTTFRILLPMSDVASEEDEEEEEALVGGAQTILLIEDHEGVRRMVARMLEDLGYEVLQVRRVAEAVALCQSTSDPIDMVLADIVMPELSGPRVVAELQEIRPGLAVLYMTGYPDDVLGPYGMSTSSANVLLKPFTQDKLAERVRQMLEEAENQS